MIHIFFGGDLNVMCFDILVILLDINDCVKGDLTEIAFT